MARRAASWGVEVTGAKQLKKALKVLAETEAPFIKEALAAGARIVEGEGESRAPGGIARAVTFAGVRGVGGEIRALVEVKHRGATAMEFGRTTYYEGYKGRAQKSGRKVKRSGQRARPFIGIKQGDAAIGASKERVRELLSDAFEQEWNRIGAEGE